MAKAGIKFASFGGWERNKKPWNRRILRERPLLTRSLQLKAQHQFRNQSRRLTGSSWEKVNTSSHYLFLYAAENSNCAYYHTEKVYHALLADSLPVYVGAKTIDGYVPTGSIIKASDFKDT